MNENKSKRKDWVKNFAIIFLTILLILTFFSQTIMNYSLPQVATQYVSSGNITTRIRGTGTVEAVDPYSVILGGEDPETVSLHKINKLAVQVGDIVEKGDVLLYLDEKANSALEALQEELDAAEKAYETAILAEGINSSVVSQANDSFDADKYSQQIIAAQNEVDVQQKNVEELATAVAAYTLEIELRGANPAEPVTSFEAKYKELKNITDATQVDYDEKDAEFKATEAVLNAVRATYDEAKAANDNAINEGKTEEERADLISALTEAEQQVKEAEAQVMVAQSALNDAKAVLDEAKKNSSAAEIMVSLAKQLEGFKRKENEAKNLLNEKETIRDVLKGNKDSIINLRDAKEALAEAKAALEKAKEEDIDSIVVADVSGTITSIKFKSGESVSTGEEVMVIQPAGQGYTMSVSVTTEQARKVQVGDTAELVNNWWYEDVKVVLRSIRPDSSDPAKKKLLVFSIDGDVSEGQSLTVSIGERSANYEYVVPNSAIREDNNGKFILIVESKSSPLGNRYIASRVDVQVVASDDTQSAVTGALQGYEFVITTSTHPINAGQLVRLAEN